FSISPAQQLTFATSVPDFISDVEGTSFVFPVNIVANGTTSSHTAVVGCTEEQLTEMPSVQAPFECLASFADSKIGPAMNILRHQTPTMKSFEGTYACVVEHQEVGQVHLDIVRASQMDLTLVAKWSGDSQIRDASVDTIFHTAMRVMESEIQLSDMDQRSATLSIQVPAYQLRYVTASGCSGDIVTVTETRQPPGANVAANKFFVVKRQAQVDKPADGDHSHINKEGSICKRVKARRSPGSDLQEARPPPVAKKRGLPRDERPRPKTLVRVGTLNITTLTSKTREIADLMKRRTIRILCLQDPRWKGSKAIEIGDDIKLFYHGVETKKNGVAIAVDASLENHISSVTRVSDNIIFLRIATAEGFWTVVSVYAPQCGCTEMEKTTFYEELDDVIRSVPKSDYLTIGGDFNGHVGRDKTGFERMHGGRGFGSLNQDGERIIESAEAHDLAIASTFFTKKESQKVTYSSADRQGEMDHVLVWRTALKTVNNVKSIPGEEVAGQHRPVIADQSRNANSPVQIGLPNTESVV
ncbi:hypothetical protein Y032_1001g3350, partial [Ancylostoma ceylanicum]